MSQHDYDIANAPGATVRSDLNNAFGAVATNNSAATEPASMYANMWWFDTSTNILKQRNNANDAWVNVALKDGNGWTPYRQGTQLGTAAILTTDTDGTLAANSDTRAPSQKAVKTYADTKIPSSYLDTDNTLAAASDVKVATQKAVKAYVDNNSVESYAAGGYLIFFHGYIGVTTATSATKVYEAIVPRAGTLRVVFGFSGLGNSTTFYGRIYRNGSAVGTARSTATQNVWTDYSEDITGWAAGDLIQIYAHVSASPTGENVKAGTLALYENVPSKEAFAPASYVQSKTYTSSMTPATVTGSGSIGNIGDLWIYTGGGASTTLYVKTGATTWTAK